MNLRIRKWLVSCPHNPHKNSISNHLEKISESLGLLSSDYKKIIFLGDFNVTDDEHHMKSFWENYGLKNLIGNLYACSNLSNPAFIDLILTNVPCSSFKSTCVGEKGLSDFNFMTLTVMRKIFKKYHPKTINYRSNKSVSNDEYRKTLLNNLSKGNFINDDDSFHRFCHRNLNALNKHAPHKKKHAQVNKKPFLNKELSKAIMIQTKLQNILLQNRSE